MATYYSNKRGGWQLKADVTYTQSVSANTSDVTIKVYLVADPTWRINATAMSGSTTINGSTAGFSANPSTNGGTTNLLTSRTVKVAHSSDGSKSVGISFNFNLNIYSGTLGGNVGTLSGSASLSLTKIPRAFSFIISTQTIDMGSNLTVKVDNNGSGFEGWLYMKFGSKKVKLSGPTPLGSNFNVSPSIADFAPVIPNATSGTGSIVLETWQGNTKIGEASITLTLKVPTNIVPSISSVGVSDTSTVPDKVGAFYVQSQSKLKLATAGVGIYGSTVKSVSHTVDGKTIGTGTDTTVDLASTNIAAGDKKIITTLTDSRGRTATKETSITITAYSAPQITSFKAERDSKTQTTVNVAKAVSVSPIGESKNTYTVKTEFKLATATDWTTFKTESNTSAATLPVPNIDISKSYDIRVIIADKFNSISFTLSVSTAKTLLSMYKDVGVGIGKIYEEGHGVLDVGGDVYLEGLLDVKGLSPRPIPSGFDLNSASLPVGIYSVPEGVLSTLKNGPGLTSKFATLIQLPTEQILRTYEPSGVRNTINLYRGHSLNRSEFGNWLKESGSTVAVSQLPLDGRFEMNATRSGNMVTLSLDNVIIRFGSGDIAERKKIATLPEGLRPKREAYMVVTRNVSASSMHSPIVLTFGANGDVLLTCIGEGMMRCAGTVTYMTDDTVGVMTV